MVTLQFIRLPVTGHMTKKKLFLYIKQVVMRTGVFTATPRSIFASFDPNILSRLGTARSQGLSVGPILTYFLG